MIKDAIAKLMEKEDLTREEAASVMREIMAGQAQPAQIAAFLVAMRLKGERPEEITGCAQAMRSYAVKINSDAKNLLDTCGTGGDKKHTFNISTVSAFVAAGAGAVVAKHGNRAVSSECGSADLLKELGVNIEASRETVEKCLKQAGIAFLYAPLMHESMKYAAPVRKEIGIRTIFNILGPLTNPAGARHHLLGVFDKGFAVPLAKALLELGSTHALVAAADDGLDELSTSAATFIVELKGGRIKTYKIKPSDFRIKKSKPGDLTGGGPAVNAGIALGVLSGKKGPCRDIVVLNAGAALYAADIAKDIKSGAALAEGSIDTGRAAAKLDALKRLTNE